MVQCALQYVARRHHEHQADENAAQVGLHRSRRQLRDEQVNDKGNVHTAVAFPSAIPCCTLRLKSDLPSL